MGCKCKRPNLIKNKFISTCIGGVGLFAGLSIVFCIGGLSVYITSYIHYHQDFVTMHYGYFFNLISDFATTIGTGIGGILENKIGFTFTTLLGTTIALVCDIFFFKIANIWLCYILIFLIGIGIGIGTSLLGKNVMLYLPKKKGLLSSVLQIMLILIIAPVGLLGEKLIAHDGETLKEGQEFYSEKTANNTYLFFMLAFFTIPIGDLIFLIFNYEYQEDKKKDTINPVKVDDNEDNKKDEDKVENSINENENEQKEENGEQTNDQPKEEEEEDSPINYNILEEMQNSNSYRNQKIKTVLKTFRFWRMFLASFLLSFPMTFLNTTGRTFGALIGIDGGALQFLIVLQSGSLIIFGLIFGCLTDKKGPLLIFRFGIIISILPTVLLFLFLDIQGVYLLSFICVSIASSAKSVSFGPLFMEVYGIRESVILGAVLAGGNIIAEILTTILAFVIPFYYTTEELKEPYKIVYLVGIITTSLSFVIFLFERGKKFDYEVDTSDLDKLVDRDTVTEAAKT